MADATADLRKFMASMQCNQRRQMHNSKWHAEDFLVHMATRALGLAGVQLAAAKPRVFKLPMLLKSINGLKQIGSLGSEEHRANIYPLCKLRSTFNQ